MKLKSNEPFWLIKNGMPYTYPSLKETVETQVLIIGGGITGSLIAHQCVKEGFQTLLVDRRDIANGSTSATTSMLQYEIDVPLYQLIEMIGKKPAVESYQACFDSIDQLQELVKEVGSDCGYTKKDSLYFASYKKDVAWLKKEYEVRKEHGFPVQWLTREEISEKFGIHHTFGGILSNQGGSIDAFRLAHDLIAHNVKKGLVVYDKTNIVSREDKAKKVHLLTDHQVLIKADKVIYCNGFESTELIKDKFVKLLSTYAVVGEANTEDISKIDRLLVWNTSNPYLYMRTTMDGRLLVGGGDVAYISSKKRDSYLSRKSKSLTQDVHKYLSSNDFVVDFSWAGTFGETKDGLPYIGEHPDFPHSYFVLGFGGNGITFSVIGMEMVADYLRKKKHRLTDYFKFQR